MFERRQQRVTSNLGFSHVQRSLRNGEQIPALPGLTDQILACRHELARSRREGSTAEQIMAEAEAFYPDQADEDDD